MLKVLSILATIAVTGCAASGAAGEAAPCDLAIVNVSVVPMDSERILPGRTVTIGQGRFTGLSYGEPPPACGRLIDGSGLYLAPGLNDLHVHVEASAFIEAFGLPPADIPFEDVLYPYLAHGVTGVRVMSGSPDILEFRSSGRGPAPRLVVASPMLSGEPPILPEPATRIVENADAARAIVSEYASAGYDLIKIRGNLDRPSLEGVFEAAETAGLDVDGHIPNLPNWTVKDLGGDRQVGVAHLDELALRVIGGSADPVELAKALRSCGCYVASTLQVERSAADQLRDYDAVAARPEMRFVHPLLREAFWARERNPYLAEKQDPAFFDALLETDKALVRVLRKEGVTILAGTDAMSPMVAPGSSLPDELELLVDAGLTPFEALRAATAAPADRLSAFADVGAIEVGRIANAILLHRNPLEDINAIRRPTAIIVGGEPIERAALDARMEAIAAGYARK